MESYCEEMSRMKAILECIDSDKDFSSLLSSVEFQLWNASSKRIGNKDLNRLFYKHFINLDTDWIRDYDQVMTNFHELEISGSQSKLISCMLIVPFVRFYEIELNRYSSRISILQLEPLIEKLNYRLLALVGSELMNLFEKELKDIHQQVNQSLELKNWIEKYPALAKNLTITTIDSIKGIKLFIDRLEQDFSLFSNLGSIQEKKLEITSISPLGSDFHSAVGEVLRVEFGNNFSIVYKPKIPDVEIFLAQVVESFTEITGEVFVHIPKSLYKTDYYWQKYVENEDPNIAKADRHFTNLGMFIGLCSLLLLEDYHKENLIYSGDDIFAIDNEIIAPSIFSIQANYFSFQDKAISLSQLYSITNTRLVPDIYNLFYSDFSDEYGISQCSGLENPEKRLLIIQGLNKFALHYKSNQVQLKTVILNAFLKLRKTRILVRSTSDYYDILKSVTRPINYKSEINFFICLVSKLHSSSKLDVNSFINLHLHELQSLSSGYIPSIFQRVDQNGSHKKTNSFDRLNIQLENWGDSDFVCSQTNILNWNIEFDSSNSLFRNSFLNGRFDYLQIARNIAHNISFIYNNMCYESHWNRIKLNELGFTNGIVGVAYFLALVLKHGKDKEISSALEKLINIIHSRLKENLSDTINSSLEIKSLKYGVKILSEILDHQIIEGILKQLDSIPLFDQDDILLLEFELHPTFNKKIKFSKENHDGILGGNLNIFYDILKRQLPIGHDSYKGLDELLLVRQKDGFKFINRTVRFGISDGLAGIGLVLLSKKL
jgi:lantibiotic modifying enzyme